MMLIVSHVCAEFRDRSGEVIFTVGPDRRDKLVMAPDAIQEDPIFALVIGDGSLKAPEKEEERKKLEANPREGIAPDGKEEVIIQMKPKKSGTVKKAAAGKKPAAAEAVKT